MIDFNLIDEPINIENFTVPVKEEYPMLVLGSIIRNEYDNQRIILNEEYHPLNILHYSKDKENVVLLKGVKLQANTIIKNLFSSILNQEKNNINLITYQNLISQYNLACKETYALFFPGMYPIDFDNLKSICEDSFNEDKKIFQHLLNIDEKVFDFQKFASLRLFILT